MNDFLDLVRQRQSVRSYQDRPVEREKIERCIETARLAPSACNSQPWRFVVVDDPLVRNDLAVKGIDPLMNFAKRAPVFTAMIAVKPRVISQVGSFLKNKPLYFFDLGIAAAHFCLQATSEGLGTCMVGWFNERAVRTILKVPGLHRVALLITIGYPADEPRPKLRKSIDEIRWYNRYQG
jgi:nitroreductase